MSHYQDLTPEDFKALINSDALIIDVRTAPETAAGIIPNALIDFDIHQSDFDAKIEDLDPEKTYLVYCRSGVRSVYACEKMHALGFQHLYNLRGGIIAWQQQYETTLPNL